NSGEGKERIAFIAVIVKISHVPDEDSRRGHDESQYEAATDLGFPRILTCESTEHRARIPCLSAALDRMSRLRHTFALDGGTERGPKGTVRLTMWRTERRCPVPKSAVQKLSGDGLGRKAEPIVVSCA